MTDLGYPRASAARVPWVPPATMVEADRLAIEVFEISLLQMMEHAGAALADAVVRLAPPGPVVVLAGAGNNGGGGLSAARHLRVRGRDAKVVLANPTLGPAATHHLATLEQMGAAIAEEVGAEPVVVDALVGYGLSGPLRGRTAALAEETRGRFVASLDYPSGHGETGAVEADVTVTLALPKHGLEDVSRLLLADLGLPPELWDRLDIDTEGLFAEGRVIELAS